MKLPNRGPVGGRPPYGGGTGKPQHPQTVVVVETLCGRPTCECPADDIPSAAKLEEADAALQVISSIADDMNEWAAGGKRRGYIARQARRLREHVAKVDAALGFEDERDDNVTSGPHE